MMEMKGICVQHTGRRLLIAGCFFFLLTTVLPAFAQKDAKAKEWLDKSSEVFGKTGALSVDFTINVKDVSNKISESFDGNIEMKGAKFHLDVPEMETWFDGKTQWVLQKEWDEVNITEPAEQEVQTLNPAVIFSIYKKGCNYKYLGEKTDNRGKKAQEIELIPQDKKSEWTKIVIQINSNDFMPVKIHIFYKNKMENIIHINKYKKKLNLEDNVFVFDKKKYPNVEIIDLR
ncbi:MAG: outer-membrane lipoprotein carrier protein LolA [Dysgonamonadaceae bacterium]|nr:outer-membrane lipoprotein carrier protein LolA [Dysgonamonadaceae bacterium]